MNSSLTNRPIVPKASSFPSPSDGEAQDRGRSIGIDLAATQILLGRAEGNVTQVYASCDPNRAVTVAREIG